MLRSWVARLFLALALLQLLPVWTPLYFPTSDGPSHLYNAFVMRELVLHHDGPIAQFWAIDWRPHPNILGHVLLAVLLGPFSAAVAEKILVSAIILLFLGGAWMLAGAADPRGRLYAFLALPFAHHQLLQYGFYNYALSAGIYLVALAVWWERRDRPDRQTIAIVALLTLLCYTAHPSSTLLLIASIGLLWLMTLPGRPLRRHVRHLAAFLPVLPLLAWFFLQQRHARVRGWPPLAQRAFALARFEILQTFDGVQLKLGMALFGLLVTLIIATIAIERRRREEDAFLVLFLIVAALFLVAPTDAAGGAFVSERLAILLPLLPLPWLTPRLSRAARATLIAALSLAAVANALFLNKHERAIARRTKAFVRAERAIPANTTVLVLNGERQPVGTFLPLLAHASGYVAIERRQVDLDNYEAGTGYFPVTQRPHTLALNLWDVEGNPANVDIDAFAPLAQYVFVWQLPDGAPVLSRLDRQYRLLAISPEARIYRRRDADTAFYELLLPVAGTAHPIDGTVERWNVEQTIANRGARPVEVRLSTCTGGPCDFVLAPGEARRVAAEPEHPFIIARIPPPAARDVTVRTIVQRDGDDGTVSFLAVPSMPLTSFSKRAIEIPGVPLTGRVRLRLWIFAAAPAEFELAAYSDDGRTELKRLSIARPANGYFSGDVARLFAPLQGRVRVRIDSGDDASRVWGFVSETGAGGTPDPLHLPTSDIIPRP